MPFEVIIPKLSTTMDEGTIVRWLKNEADQVQAGETLFELETDKAVMEVEAPISGVLGQILLPAGTTAALGEVAALIITPQEADGGQATDAVTPSHEDQPEERVKASPLARRLAQERGIDLVTLQGSGPGGRIVESDVRAALEQLAQPAAAKPGRLIASPAARKLAKESGLDLSEVTGTGPGGRIVLEDVRKAAATPPPSIPQPAAGASPEGRVLPLSGVRRVIAERMAASAQTVAQVTLTTESDATRLVEWRARIVDQQLMDPVPSYTDMALLLTARALREHPYMNARLEGEAIHLLESINIGLAVDTRRGLLVPVLCHVDQKGIASIARQARHLVEKARAGKATPDDLSGGTFTITNLGLYEIDAFTPLVNLPECAILGLGRIVAKQVVYRDEVAIRHMMTLSLAFDHRLVDGAPAARFLQRIKQLIEEPLLLLCE
jgi:pyruvate dehydrogenase E2 component (dihydrolipoamide acetyltransferase)